MKTIAVIDDDVHMGDILGEVFERGGCTVVRAYSKNEAIWLLSQNRVDLILINLILTEDDKTELLRYMQDIPLIIVCENTETLAAVKGTFGSLVEYIVKPFDARELVSCVATQLYKVEQTENGTVLTVGILRIDTLEQTLKVGENAVKLTRTECAIMKLFMENQKQVIAKNELIERISQDTPDCTERSLKQHISNLRKKIFELCGEKYIETVRGVGFRLV